MNRPRRSVYLETTVISYLTAHTSRDLIRAARQEITREGWESRRGSFDLYVSQIVADEAGHGDRDAPQRRAVILADIPRLEMTSEATELARVLLRKKVVPRKAVEDALHIAVASVHGMDFLLTWNCAHIANAEMADAIQTVVRANEYESPVICAPEELMGEWS